MFNIPVALFLYRRLDTTLRILDVIREIKPQKIYLISDGGKTPDVHMEIQSNRKIIEKAIDWDCEIIKNYSEDNRGVYQNIGLGAKWVFEREKYAIFLEDDNLPEISFFSYCSELLLRYEDNKDIMWICGTNYLEEYHTEQDASYVFTKHLMPCGWASWAHKFNKYYDGELDYYNLDSTDSLSTKYTNKALFKQQNYSIHRTKEKIVSDLNSASWDFQMAFSIRFFDLVGISPRVNLIRNIGVDNLSTHGGTSMNRIMTKRFCGIDSFPLHFPLTHPEKIILDKTYEKEVSKIILYPLRHRVVFSIWRKVKPLFGFRRNETLSSRRSRRNEV